MSSTYSPLSDAAAAQPAQHHHTYPPWICYCFTVNYILGVGVLGMPYAFYHGGIILSLLCLSIVSVLAWMTAAWLVDVELRAKLLHNKRMSDEAHNEPHSNSMSSNSINEQIKVSDDVSSPSDVDSPLSDDDVDVDAPSPPLASSASLPHVPLVASSSLSQANLLKNMAAEIHDVDIHKSKPVYSEPEDDTIYTAFTHHVKYEVNELVEIFLGKYARRIYEVCVIFYLVGALWSYASVFSSSMASHVPLGSWLNSGDSCDIYKDSSSSCSHLYDVYMLLFAVVAIPLTCMDLIEMKVLQILLAGFRFVSLGTMMITSIVALYSYPNSSPDAHSASSAPYYSDISMVRWEGLGLVFPISIYAQIFHHSIPGLSHPLDNKKKTPTVFAAVVFTTFLLYSALGTTVGLYYGGSIPQTCTLAWADYTGGHDAPHSTTPAWAQFIAYMIVLFPPIDIISAFPLNAITLGNNVMCSFLPDAAKQRMLRYKIPFRLLAAIPPIVGAIIVKDLSVILKYTGCIGVIIAFIFPCILQYKSQTHYSALTSTSVASSPSYSGRIINWYGSIYIVGAFSAVGLIAVIIASAAGWSN